MKSTLVCLGVSVFALMGCELSRQATSFEAWQVCVLPDAGSPESGEAFTVRAGPGVNLDAGCVTGFDGGQFTVTVSGIDVSYSFGDEAVPADVTCRAAPLPAGRYAFTSIQTNRSFVFEVPSADAGFPRCAD